MALYPTDRLSERDKTILRLVLRGHRSKDIARELGISPHTIDGNVRDILRTLGVADRYAAARMLADAENTAPQPLSAQSLSVSDVDPHLVLASSSAPGWSGNDQQSEDVMEESIPPPWPERPVGDRRAEGQRRNHMTVAQRIARIARTSAAIVTVFASIAFAMFLLQRLFQALSFPSH